MRIFLTYCSGQKDDSFKKSNKKVTPDRLYTSERIQKFIKVCKEAGALWAIFSDEYGVWFPGEQRKWYDKPPDVVTPAEFEQLVSKVEKSLEKYEIFFYGNIDESKFHQLYRDLIERLKGAGLRITLFKDLDDVASLASEKGDVYDPQSGVLFLAICSFRKAEEGFPYYIEDNTICARFLPDHRDQIASRRKEVFKALRQGKIFFDKANQKGHPYNQSLAQGRDFGGSEAGFYLPALWRYEGRFYESLKTRGKKAMLNSGHHFLILSGLYGIITPVDPVQLYSIPLYDDDPVQRIWRDDDFLTKVLFDYVRSQAIRRIFDFTGIYYYRDLINWQRFKGMVAESGINCDILHVFSPVGAGDNALPAFGESIAQQLIHYTEEQLCSIDSEDSIGNVYFRTIHGAREGLASDFPTGEPMIKLKKIADPDAKKILESAERATIHSYRNPNNPPDAGSSLIWQYGKGLEKLLHQRIALKIGCKFRWECGGIRSPHYPDWPNGNDFREADLFWGLFWDSHEFSGKQISLGHWAQLSRVLKRYSRKPPKDKLLRLLHGDSSGRLLEIMQKCDPVAEIRNEAVHPNVISFEEGMVKRRKIIPIINEIIDLIYPDSA
ncbi:MAG: peroxide stress protein YaaA [Methanoculleus sp.]|nr:peroxide stress protein YaaA [Methanoculleus sp.]